MSESETNTQEAVKLPEGRDIYEASFWIVPLLTEDDASARFADVKALVEKQGGTLISEAAPEMKSIAYKMLKIREGKRNHFDTGYFAWIKFEADRESVGEIDSNLKNHEDVIRHLLITTVRESTLAPARLYVKEEKVEKEIKKSDLKTEANKETSGEPISEAELDKTIEGLVVE